MHHRVHPKRYQPERDGRFQIAVEHVYHPKQEYQNDPKSGRFPELWDSRHIRTELGLPFGLCQRGPSRFNCMSFRIGQGFDFHPLVEGRRLILAGLEIPYSHGLQGHSDADVAVHALANAVLGAIGEGDLGTRFPDSDAAYKDADSIILLSSVWARAQELEWSLVNADLTIFAQRPKLAPYLADMRARLAAAIGVEPVRLNVKASNPESLGALGRGEGMAAAAIVLLEKNN
jgi:2-C-methyl-D-erythritol 2,4-cyclodiphosphate synthase